MAITEAVSSALRAPLVPSTWRETLQLVLGALVGVAAAAYRPLTAYTPVFSLTIVGLLVLAAVVRESAVEGGGAGPRQGAARPGGGGAAGAPRGQAGLVGWVRAGLALRTVVVTMLAEPPQPAARQTPGEELIMRKAAVAVGLAVGLYLIVRAVAELFVIDLSDPATYRDNWGGPSLIGVLLVHSGPGVVAAIAIAIALIRRRSSRHAQRKQPSRP
jgi:hypothetical protein